jgi:hypothetical protein
VSQVSGCYSLMSGSLFPVHSKLHARTQTLAMDLLRCVPPSKHLWELTDAPPPPPPTPSLAPPSPPQIPQITAETPLRMPSGGPSTPGCPMAPEYTPPHVLRNNAATKGLVNGQLEVVNGQLDGQLDGQLGGQLDGQLDGQLWLSEKRSGGEGGGRWPRNLENSANKENSMTNGKCRYFG